LIDDEVRADVRAALDLAASTDIEGGVLDGVSWTADGERAVDLPPSWRQVEEVPAHVREALRIGRSDLLAVASHCRGTGSWAPLLACVNAWGYGQSGYGAWRTRRILDLPDLEVRLDAAIATLDADGPLEAYYQLNNEGHLHGWGPMLFTRFLDAADLRGSGRALGLDPALATAVNGLVPGSNLGAADWGTAEYAFYLGLLHRISDEVGVAPTAGEAALAAKFAD
jgi:hypothetical protein